MRRNKLDVCLHFVWATWDRLPLITEGIQRDLYRYIETVCHDDKCEALAIGGIENHVHLLVLFSNTVTLAAFMNHQRRLVTVRHQNVAAGYVVCLAKQLWHDQCLPA